MIWLFIFLIFQFLFLCFFKESLGLCCSCCDIKCKHTIFGSRKSSAIELSSKFFRKLKYPISSSICKRCISKVLIIKQFFDIINFELMFFNQFEIKLSVLIFCEIKYQIPFINFYLSYSFVINKFTNKLCKISMLFKERIFQIIRGKCKVWWWFYDWIIWCI